MKVKLIAQININTMEICTVSEGSTESLKAIGQMKVMCYSYRYAVKIMPISKYVITTR